jgi:hypothetical protein
MAWLESSGRSSARASAHPRSGPSVGSPGSGLPFNGSSTAAGAFPGRLPAPLARGVLSRGRAAHCTTHSWKLLERLKPEGECSPCVEGEIALEKGKGPGIFALSGPKPEPGRHHARGLTRPGGMRRPGVWEGRREGNRRLEGGIGVSQPMWRWIPGGKVAFCIQCGSGSGGESGVSQAMRKWILS